MVWLLFWRVGQYSADLFDPAELFRRVPIRQAATEGSFSGLRGIHTERDSDLTFFFSA